jgi:putative transcriptional regulator
MEDTTGNDLDSREWGRRLRNLRLENDWSQADLAERLDVHPQTVSDVERGKHKLTLERLGRVLDALGYEANINLNERRPKTRAEWGHIAPNAPAQRRLIRHARRLAEAMADHLYDEFDVEAIYCFGSLTEDQGESFKESSDIDIAVKGLAARQRFEAEADLELDVIESNEGFQPFSFDLIRTEEFDKPWAETRHARDAVRIPRLGGD